MKNVINILIASPKGLMLDLLKVALSASPRFRVVAHINSAEEISGIIDRECIDIALVSPLWPSLLRSRTSSAACFANYLMRSWSPCSSFAIGMSLWTHSARARAV